MILGKKTDSEEVEASGPTLTREFYPTPRWCVQRLLEHRWVPKLIGQWLEPTAGMGDIIDAARSHRSDTHWTAVELYEWHKPSIKRAGADKIIIADWLRPSTVQELAKEVQQFEGCIMNPPFSKAEECLTIALGVCKFVACLLPLHFLSSARRQPAFMDGCLSGTSVLVLPNRPSFTGRGTDAIEYAWFIWSSQPEVRGRIEVLPITPRKQRAQCETQNRKCIDRVMKGADE